MSERLLHAAHSSPRLLLMTSQSRQKTAFQRGRTPASRWFLVPANIYTNPVAEMWAAILNKNTASFSMCKLSKLSAPDPTLVPSHEFPQQLSHPTPGAPTHPPHPLLPPPPNHRLTPCPSPPTTP